MSITKEQLKETLRNIMKEESDYQTFFKAALEKAGKSIPSMSDDEKKAFFNKIDAAWDGKGEKNEELTGNQHKLDIDGDGEIEASDLAALRAKKDESVTEGKKRFNTMYGVGKSKYVVNYHDGSKKHKDGSDFFDIQTFKNQKDFDKFQKALLQKGFIEESVNEAASRTAMEIGGLTGMNKESSGVVQLEGLGGQTVTNRFVSFTDEMNAVLSAADLVISRAGAGAIAEIIRCRIPSILIPYPFAADNHQFLNAEFLERKGATIVCPEENMAGNLLNEVREVMFNEEFRTTLRRNLFALDNGDVANRISDDISQCLKKQALHDPVQGGILRMIG